MDEPRATRPEGRARAARRLGIAAFAALLALAGLAALLLEPEARLLVLDGKGRKLAELPLPDGRFDHVFVHSYHLTPVEERFRLEPAGLFGARLRLYELRYESSGVGMPEDAELGYRLEDGKFILKMDRSFRRIPIMVSIVPGHGVVAEGVFHPFTRWAPMEGRVQIEGRYALVIRSWRSP